MQIRRAALGMAVVAALAVSGCGRTHSRYDFQVRDTAGSGAKGGSTGGSGKGGSAGQPNDPVKPGDPVRPVDPVDPVDPMACGNGRLDDFEECEGELRFSCADVGFGSGLVRCDPGTCRLDTSGCSNPLPVCDNDAPATISQLCVAALCSCDPGLVVNCGEACWRQVQCRIQVCGSSAGDPSCRPEVCPAHTQQQELALKLLGCVQGNPLCGLDPRVRRCGDGFLQDSEECEGSSLRGASCASFGFDDGALFCTPGCTIDTSKCFNKSSACGNGVIEGGETCDGRNLGGQTCQLLGFPAGRLSCSGCQLDTSGCGQCGNGVIDSGEQCDGMRLKGVTCNALGFGSGVLLCGGGCSFDPSLCAVCGNGEIEAGENCDGGNLAGASCDSLGLGSGSLSCSPTSCHFDTRSCNSGAQCGNGVAEADEDCDGRDFTAQSCDTLGYRFGSVGCNTATCRFDLSGCTGAGSIECVDECIDVSCLGLIERCLASPDCQKIRSCLDSCRDDPTVNCGLACTGNLEGLALATVASDCVADCVDGCR